MAGAVLKPDGVVRADCEHCGTICERSFTDGDDLSIDDNKEIVERTKRHHEHKCPEGSDA